MNTETVITRLKHAREEAGLTLAELASAIGYAQTTLSSVENGHDQPSRRLLTKWIEALQINEAWLKTGQGEPFEPTDTRKTRVSGHELVAPIRFRIGRVREHATELLRELDQLEQDLRHSRKGPKSGKGP